MTSNTPRMTPSRSYRLWLDRFADCRSGVAAIEFAIVAPVMIMMMAGTVELGQALTVYRRVHQVAAATADLVGRSTATSTAEVAGIVEIASEILRPFQASPLKLSIGNVKVPANNPSQTTVCWAYQFNGGADANLRAGGTYVLPSGLVTAGESVVVSSVDYAYTSPFTGQFIKGTVTFGKTFFIKPRLSSSITYNGTPC